MNALTKIRPQARAASIAHSVLAYDRASEELDLELPIPFFMDTLALKIANVPPEDEYGAHSYPLGPKALETFRFLLGLEINLPKRQYYLESTLRSMTGFPLRKLEALELLTQVTPRPRYARTSNAEFSERELVLPALRLLDATEGGWLTTDDLIRSLAKLFGDCGPETEDGQTEPYFSQKVRTMIAHRDQPSNFIKVGLAEYERQGLRISDHGRATLAALLP